MSALPVSASESAVRAAIERLSRVQPGAYHVVSCYLKLEPRDKTRGKYLIKIKNRIRVAACDRTSARFFEVTAYDVVELPSLTAEATRPGKFHGERQAKRGNMLAGGFGEHNYHMRIRVERQRHYAQVADRIFQIHTQDR